MNVSTFDSCKAIEEAARRRSDESMLLKISGVDLIARRPSIINTAAPNM